MFVVDDVVVQAKAFWEFKVYFSCHYHAHDRIVVCWAMFVELRSVQNLLSSQVIYEILVENGISSFFFKDWWISDNVISVYPIYSTWYSQPLSLTSQGTDGADCCLFGSPSVSYPRFWLDTWLWVKIKNPKEGATDLVIIFWALNVQFPGYHLLYLNSTWNRQTCHIQVRRIIFIVQAPVDPC